MARLLLGRARQVVRRARGDARRRRGTGILMSPTGRARVAEVVGQWEGTPYREWAETPGPAGGADCTLAVLRIAEDLRLLPPIPREWLPLYPWDWALHHREPFLELMLYELSIFARCRLIDRADGFADGDVLVMRTSLAARVPHHLALQTRGAIFHVVRPKGVLISRAGDLMPGAGRTTIGELVVYGLRFLEDQP